MLRRDGITYQKPIPLIFPFDFFFHVKAIQFVSTLFFDLAKRGQGLHHTTPSSSKHFINPVRSSELTSPFMF